MKLIVSDKTAPISFLKKKKKQNKLSIEDRKTLKLLMPTPSPEAPLVLVDYFLSLFLFFPKYYNFKIKSTSSKGYNHHILRSIIQ